MCISKVWKTVPHSHYPGMLTVEGPESAITVVTSAIGVDFESHCRRVADANLIGAAPEMLASLKKAAEVLRKYEILHWAKETPESDAKAKVNGDLAAEFEAVISKALTGESK